MRVFSKVLSGFWALCGGSILWAAQVDLMPDIDLEKPTGGSAAVAMMVDDVLVVTLPTQFSTGFSWIDRVVDQSTLSRFEASSELGAADSGTMGGPEVQKFRYRANKSGHTRIVFQYKRLWLLVDEMALDFSVDVEVR